MRFLYFFVLCFLISTFSVNAEKDPHHAHKHHLNEIGVANSMLYIFSENGYAYGLHAHYIRYIPHTKFGYGFGYERVFGHHQTNTIGILGSYNPFIEFYFNFIHVITFEDKSNQVDLALHFEVLYEFELYNFHIGPTIGYSLNPNDQHISIGVHMAYTFE